MVSSGSKWMRLLSLVLVGALGTAVHAADKSDKSEKDRKKGEKLKVKDEKKVKSAPKTPADLFVPTPEFEAAQKASQNFAERIEAEVAARAVPLPAGMSLDVEWYSPHLNVQQYGRMVNGWVYDDVILVETDKFNLLCIDRANGVEKWRCQLTDAIRYSPSVSRNNVVVNVKNYLIGIEKNAGYVRWKLLPNFVMSCAPLVVDPPAYPREYTKEWKNLESIYVGGWDGRFYSLFVRARLNYYLKHIGSTDFNAPEFDLFPAWHRTHKERGIITSPAQLKDNLLYYAADDNNIYSVTRDNTEREPYYLLGTPTTSITITAPAVANVTNSVLNSLYIGGRDNSVYCLDRLTLKKKWNYPAGYAAYGSIMADEAATPYVYVATENGMLNALLITPAKAQKNGPEIPENYSVAWQTKAEGAITASEDTVYLGTARNKDSGSFGGILAVEKASGKTLWEVPAAAKGGFFSQYLEFHNHWTNPNQQAHVYAIAADNRLISLKEKVRDTGLRAIKQPTPEQEMPKAPRGDKKPKAEGDAAAAPANEEKKE